MLLRKHLNPLIIRIYEGDIVFDKNIFENRGFFKLENKEWKMIKRKNYSSSASI
jgi:hypothetical protein